MPFSAGSRIGPYEILAPLGAGGMGEVYRAKDVRLGRDVAIKVLPEAFAQDAARLARLEREARTLAALSHPNIATIFGLEDVGGAPHLVLELVDGETLAHRLRQGPLPVPEAIAICIQIAAAVEAAHERDIVHRDLKPGNVMVNAAGRVKVLDFGLAKSGTESGPDDLSRFPTRALATGHTQAGVILGTAAYMSPEQARGLQIDRRSDVWSFGCVLYECLAGRAAFAGPTVSDTIARILEHEPDWGVLPLSTPVHVRALLRRCLQKEAAERPRDIRDVRLALEGAGAGVAPDDASRETSIAVLPFAHASGPEDEHFADGITEDILNALSQFDGLRVAARTSSFAFKGRQEDLRLIGEKLNVAMLLEGSMRRAGNRLRITVRLVKAADGYQLWSERYDREMADVFELQDEIANAVAAKFKLILAVGTERARARRGTRSLEAYDLFHKGRALQVRRGQGVIEAIACFEQAIAIDPDYADALATMSDSYRLMATYGMAPPDEVMPKAKAAAQRALALDADVAEAHATLADIHAQYDRDYRGAERSWQRAIAIDPRHTRARCERALWSFGFGGLSDDEATSEMRRAIDDDPLNVWAAAMHSLLLGMVGGHDAAIAEAQRSVGIDPGAFVAQWSLVRSYVMAGQSSRAVDCAAPLLSRFGRHHILLGDLATAYAGLQNHEAARAVYDELEARSRLEFVAPSWLSVAAAAAGLTEMAMELAMRAVERRDPMAVMGPMLRYWDLLRPLPGYQELIRKLAFVRPGAA